MYHFFFIYLMCENKIYFLQKIIFFYIKHENIDCFEIQKLYCSQCEHALKRRQYKINMLYYTQYIRKHKVWVNIIHIIIKYGWCGSSPYIVMIYMTNMSVFTIYSHDLHIKHVGGSSPYIVMIYLTNMWCKSWLYMVKTHMFVM
jgi:hypothetical protein